MPDLVQFLILFGVGSAAGAINVMAGSGSALTLPALIFLGLDPVTANGTNRVAILVQNISATTTFHRAGSTRLRDSARLAVWALPGAVIGAFAAVQISGVWFERILGVVMIGVVLSMAIPRPDRQQPVPQRSKVWTYLAMLGIGFYGGFIQVGVGFLFMAAFFYLLRLDLVMTTVHKVTVVLLYTVPTLLVFAWAGSVDWLLGCALAVGNGTGAWVAARMAVQKGEKAVRAVLVVAVLVMAAKLFGLF